MKTIKINHNDENIRLDNFLSKTFKWLKKPAIYKAIRNNKVKVNNKRVKFDYRVQFGDEIKLYLNDALLIDDKRINTIQKQDFEVIYEDVNIILVYKPKGLLVHADTANNNNTLINQVITYLIKSNQYNPNQENSFVPSLVNRLDRNTAGIVLIAKNHKTLDLLNEKMKNHEINKYYIARVHGIIDPKQATMVAYLTKNNNNNIVNITKKPINDYSKKIVTEYKMISHDRQTSLIEINLLTGRTHQIRAHFNYINYPLVGETKYTKSNIDKSYKSNHQALCAYKITFNFKNKNNHLDYLNNKSFVLDKKLININL